MAPSPPPVAPPVAPDWPPWLDVGPRRSAPRDDAGTTVLALNPGRAPRRWWLRRIPGHCDDPAQIAGPVRAAAKALDDLARRRRYPQRVYVCCQHGINRTGLVVCAWLHHYAGRDVDAAVAAFVARRGAAPRPALIDLLRAGVFATPPPTK